MRYLIGDIQGCYEPLQRLLAEVGFSPSRDLLYPLGDLVNRGPASAQVLRFFRGLDGAAQCLLGNHDIYLLAVSLGLRGQHGGDTFDDVLQAPDVTQLLEWLRHQRLAVGLDVGSGTVKNSAGAVNSENTANLPQRPNLLVHAGTLPQWSRADTLAHAAELETALQSPSWQRQLADLFAGSPSTGRVWHDDLQSPERLRVIVNALTRLRYCTAAGEMEFKTKEAVTTTALAASAAQPPAGFMPWFEVPHRATAQDCIAFGHWSTLGLVNTPTLKALDTGCVWGGPLTALCWETGELIGV